MGNPAAASKFIEVDSRRDQILDALFRVGVLWHLASCCLINHLRRLFRLLPEWTREIHDAQRKDC